MTFNEFKSNVELWAAERGIYDHSSTEAQLMKALSELGELADAIIKGDDEALKDAVGDVAVCVINAAYLDDVSLEEVAEMIADINNEADASEITLPAQVVGWVAEGIGAYLSGRSTDDAFIAPLVALVALCLHQGLGFMDCCEHAWNQIKDRKGRMVAGGAFVKDEEEQKQDGGPSLPEGEVGGITLRDYFSAKAMQSIISMMDSAQYNYSGANHVASDAYAFADAMLKERSK